MMKDKLLIAFGVLLVGISAYFLYQMLVWLGSSLKDVNASVGVALIAGATTIISSVSIASYNSRKAKEQVAFADHRAKKAEIYNEFMDIVIQLIRNTKAGKKGNDLMPQNIEEFFYKFTSKVTIYGGPGVVKAYANWRSESAKPESTPDTLPLIDTLFREMRSDLGESNRGIDPNKLLGLYVTGGKSEIKSTTDGMNVGK